MKGGWQGIVAVGIALGVSGCVKAQTRIVEMPRVDQELSGNRGYLAGIPPPPVAGARPATRQIIMTDIELPTAQELRWRKPAPRSPAGKVPPPAAETPAPTSSAAPATPSTASLPMTTPLAETYEGLPPVEPAAPIAAQLAAPQIPSSYRVQKGDSLEKIAKKVYGDANRWPKIYQANRQLLKNPNRLYPGQELTIPELPGGEEAAERLQQAAETEPLK